jgi:hypothetical protein
MSLLSTLLVTLAGLSLATMFVSWLVASRSAREARITIFPIVREEEITRARRARIISSLTGVVAAIMAGAFFLSGQVAAPTALPQMVAQATLLPAEPISADVTPRAQPPLATPAPSVVTPLPPSTQPPLATATPLPTMALVVVPPSPTPTTPSTQPPPETNTPEAIPPSPRAQPPLGTATLPPATASLTSTEVTSDTAASAPTTPSSPVSPVESAQPSLGTPTAVAETPIPPGTQIGPIAFSTQVTSRRQPINPTTVFSDTVSRVYAVFPYRGMRNGMTWSQVWYFNGVEFNRGQDTWNWGATDLSYVFTKVVGVGTYRLELYVNNTLLSSGEFAVQGPAAVGGPENP